MVRPKLKGNIMATLTQTSTVPSFFAYAVKGDGDNAIWNRIGAAWDHRDGKGLSITLSATPVGGRIVLRAPKEKGNA